MIRIPCEQGSEQWALARRGIPTASCMSRIIQPAKGKMSAQARKYACELIAEKFVDPRYWIQPLDPNSAYMDHGSRTEAEAAKFFAFHTGLHLRRGGFIKSDCERYGCSPDALIVNPEDDMKFDGGLELKCPAHKTHVEWLLDGGLPTEHRPQVHASLVVTGLPVWHFMSYANGLPPLLVKAEPDDYTDKVRKCLEDFCGLLKDLSARVQSFGAVEGEVSDD